jgi:hypothetical protein
VWADVADLPDVDRAGPRGTATVSVLVEGWGADARECISALLRHAPTGVGVQLIDLGDVDGAGSVVHELAADPRVTEWHVRAAAGGWAAARLAGLRADRSPVQIWCEPSTVLTGDAISPLLAELSDPSVVAAGWRGVNVDLDDEWRSFVDAPPGEVDALLGYLLAVRRDAALAVGGPDVQARYYRNADIEFCFRLRAAGLGRLVVPQDPLPVRQQRHHGYHDVDPATRERESRRNYDRFLRRFRGRTDLLAPR